MARGGQDARLSDGSAVCRRGWAAARGETAAARRRRGWAAVAENGGQENEEERKICMARGPHRRRVKGLFGNVCPVCLAW